MDDQPLNVYIWSELILRTKEVVVVGRPEPTVRNATEPRKQRLTV